VDEESSWVSRLLVGLTLAAGLAWVLFALARPYLPAGWFR
jgi:hypothetical protein